MKFMIATSLNFNLNILQTNIKFKELEKNNIV